MDSTNQEPFLVALQLKEKPTSLVFIVADPTHRLDTVLPVSIDGTVNSAALHITNKYISLTLQPSTCDFTDFCFRYVINKIYFIPNTAAYVYKGSSTIHHSIK